MTPLPRTISLSIARTGLALIVLGFTVFSAWSVGDVLGQAPPPKKPRVEEEEDTPKAKTPPKKTGTDEGGTPPKKKTRPEEEEDTPKTKRKVIPVEEEENAKAKRGPSGVSVPTGADLKQLAEQASHPAVKSLFNSLKVPHDLVRYPPSSVTVGGKSGPREDPIEPCPHYLGNDPGRYRNKSIQFRKFTIDWVLEKPFSPILENLEAVRPYEAIAQDRVRAFLGKDFDKRDPDERDHLSRYNMLVAAEQVLSSVLRWHESALQTRKRTGEKWNEVGDSLRTQLLDEVLLKEMQVLSQVKDWDKVLVLSRRLAVSYTKNEERQRIFRPVADMIQDALNDPTGSEAKKQEARRRLLDLEREYPGDPAFKPLSETLRNQAQSFLDAAKEALKNDKKDTKRILDLLQQAKETWPELAGIRPFELQLNLEHPILRVGMRGKLPLYLSPAWACSDNEKRVVEMLFESLVKLVPDEAGGFRYVPGLAEYRPNVVPLGRQFELPPNARWSDDKLSLDAADIGFSLKLLQQEGLSVGRSRVWGDLLDNVERKRNPLQMTLRLKQGFLDPLALMTFKILPHDQPVKDESFAKNPLSSGPFRFDASRHSDEQNRECLFFIANPSYGQRPGKQGLPHVQEIRLYSFHNAVEELAHGKLDLVLDLTAQEANELRQKTDELQIEVPMPSPSVPNRRICFLAINNKKISDPGLRKALAYAINREALLDAHFRGPLKRDVHKALNGPFPVGSWACNPAVAKRQNQNSLDMFDEGRARNLMQETTVRQAAGVGRWTLSYPEGDPALAEAMKALCKQVNDATGLILLPTPLDPLKLREVVEQSQSHELAYCTYDFPDEMYWLAPLMGPPPRAMAREDNIFRFTNPRLPLLLGEAVRYRDFAVVRKHVWMIHEWLAAEMPFIPLWQLDPLMAHHRDVKPAALDPQLVFSNIENWRLLIKK